RGRNDRAEDVHGRAALGHLLEGLPKEGRERAVLDELGLEVAKLVFVRKIAIEQEIGNLFVLGLADELFDPVAAVLKEVVADRGDGGGGGDHPFKTLGSLLFALDGHGSSVAQPCRWPI